MLTVFRSVLPAGNGPAGESVAGSAGILEMELVWPLVDSRWGNPDDVTARMPEGDPIGEAVEIRDGEFALLPRVFGTGSEGSGPVGGAIDGRDGRGRVAAMVLFCCLWWVQYDAVGYAEERRRSQTLFAETTLSHSYPPTSPWPLPGGRCSRKTVGACSFQICLRAVAHVKNSVSVRRGPPCRRAQVEERAGAGVGDGSAQMQGPGSV